MRAFIEELSQHAFVQVKSAKTHQFTDSIAGLSKFRIAAV
jgi:hypothetical protein